MQPPPDTASPSRLSTLAIVGLVLSVLGVVPEVANALTMFRPDAVSNALATGCGASFTALPGLVVSAVALARCTSSGSKLRGRGLAIAGIVVALLTFFAGLVMLASCGALVSHRLGAT